MTSLRAIEFFSGMGAFSEASRGTDVSVIKAFDQNSNANLVFGHNFEMRPDPRNLESINTGDLPDADLWWLSPPCTPYTRRGNRKDIEDPRAKSLLNLLKILPERPPEYLLLENVIEFSGSRMYQMLQERLQSLVAQKSGFASAIRLNAPSAYSGHGELSSWYKETAARYRISSDQQLCRFAVDLAVRPYALQQRYLEGLPELIRRARAHQALIRGARLAVLSRMEDGKGSPSLIPEVNA